MGYDDLYNHDKLLFESELKNNQQLVVEYPFNVAMHLQTKF